jgi:hypothetical protein
MTRSIRSPIACAAWIAVATALSAGFAAEPDSGVPLDSFDAFRASSGDWLPPRLGRDEKLWRQVAPSVWWLLRPHADALRSRSGRQQAEIAAAAAEFILRQRARFAEREVIAPGRPIVALLDPDRGLDRRQITALASAYGTTAEVFKLDRGGGSLDDVASAWLRGVGDLILHGRSGTVVVVGHGLPTEIQSYHIPVGRLAAILADAATQAAAAGTPPGEVVLVFDDCFSADFCINLAKELDARSGDDHRLALPVMIAGANRDQYGHVDIGEKFVTHFWDVVIELYFIRSPRPRAISLGDFFGPVDNYMYGFGRAPVVENGKIAGYRLVNPELVQDPVCFVPLDDAELEDLRMLLGLPRPARLLPLLDAG